MGPSSPSNRQTHAAPQAQGASSTWGIKYPILYQPCAQKTAGQLFHTSDSFEPAHSWPGGGCPFLTVLQPVYLLQLPGGEAPAVIPGSPHTSIHPSFFPKESPVRMEGRKGVAEGMVQVPSPALQEQPCPSSDRSPLGSQQDKSWSTSSTGQG